MKLLLLLATTSLFGLNMEEAELRALQKNRSIQIGDLQSQQNDAQYAQALLSWFPEVTFGSMWALLQKNQKISSLQKQKHLFSNQFTLTQPIFSSELLGNLKLSRLVKEGGRVGQAQVMNDTIWMVRTSYMMFGLKQQQSQLEQIKLSYIQHLYQDEEIRFKSGRSTKLKLAQTKAALSCEISKDFESRKETTTAKHELSLLLHLSPEEEAHLEFGGFPALDSFPFLKDKQQELQNYFLSQNALLVNPPPVLSLFSERETEELIEKAHRNKPELKKSSLVVQASQVKTSESRTQYLPEISAFVDYGYYQPINGQFFRQRNDWAGGIQISWSLFNSLKREMKSKENTALRKAAQLAFHLEIEKLEFTIRQDLHQIEEACFLYQNAQDNLFLSQQMMEEAEVQHAAGSLSDLQLEEAKKFLAETDFNSTQAYVALLQKYFQLEHDIGSRL